MSREGPAQFMFDRSPHIVPVRSVTADIPGIGGTLKQRPEDFIVEEIPAYDPSGEGEHIYLFVQKIGLSTQQLVEIIARHFRVRPGAVGYAGLKDRHAITRQVLSVHVPGKKPEDFPMLRHERVQVLWTDLHANKLRRGHLKGNRFAIKVRGVPLSGVLHAKKALEILARTGVPNRIGEQRFGHMANNHLVGRAIVLGDARGAIDELMVHKPDVPQSEPQRRAREAYARGELVLAAQYMDHASRIEAGVLTALVRGVGPARALRTMGELQTTFVLSAFQSAVFNSVLDRRTLDGTLGTLMPGDVATKHANNAAFVVEASDVREGDLQGRLERFEISPSGPLWGAGMLRGHDETDLRELSALREFGLTPDDLLAYTQRTGDELRGERRPLRVPLMYPDVEGGADEHGPYVRCAFELPPGSFATVVMREIMKPDPIADHAPDAQATDTPEHRGP